MTNSEFRKFVVSGEAANVAETATKEACNYFNAKTIIDGMLVSHIVHVDEEGYRVALCGTTTGDLTCSQEYLAINCGKCRDIFANEECL